MSLGSLQALVADLRRFLTSGSLSLPKTFSTLPCSDVADCSILAGEECVIFAIILKKGPLLSL